MISELSLKRGFDFILASFALAVSFPIWFLVAIAIKMEDGGPVFFPQMRWGKDKKPIKVYKFRTMVVDADGKFGRVQAGESDLRITRVGRLLRATALDEMPQILNIWKGDMSWVGPRALPMNEVQVKGDERDLPDEAIPGFDQRCRVRPGLTGVAQIYAPRDVLRRNKFRYDLFYIKKQTFWLDVRLIVFSVWISVRGKWESRERFKFSRSDALNKPHTG
jgi:lipopolysaccharide/colanic/teichoic acid biosynthesis glycosyltransferase